MDCKNVIARSEATKQSIFHSSLFILPILAFCASFALADDDFDLPDDVQKAEVPASAEEVPEGPINFAPIEETTTSEPAPASSRPENVNSKKVVPAASAKSDTSYKEKKKRTPLNNRSAKAIVDSYLPVADEPVTDVHVTDAPVTDVPAAFKEHLIPEELDRPLRVGIYTGVKELYLKYQGETVRVTPHGNMVRFEADGNSTEDIAHEFNSEDGGCLAVAADKKSLGRACYPGSIMFRNTNGKLDAINSVDVEDYLRGVIPYEIGKLDSSRIEAIKAQIKASKMALDGVIREADVGSRTVLDVLDAEQEYLNYRVNLVSAERNMTVAALNVLAAMGKMTAESLKLNVNVYSYEAHYDDVNGKIIGTGI